MTQVLLEDFEDLAAWTTTGTSHSIITGRTGQALQMAGSGPVGDNVVFNIPSGDQQAVLVVGFAYRPTGSTTARIIFELRSDSGATLHNTLSMTGAAAGDLRFNRGGSALATSAPGVIVADTWNYIEVRATLGDSPNGAIVVRVNETQVINTTGLDTKAAGTKTVYDQFRIHRGSATSSNQQFDDLYLLTGAAETFLGDITVPLPSVGAGVQIYNGSSFVDAPVKMWNGTSFVDADAVKVWNGTSFVDAV